jgi:AcrR family transcriptional regulator
VGIGTVYRHFPTKAALVAALADDHFARLVTLGHEELEAGGDAWEAFERFMWRSARQAAEDRGLAEIVANEPEAMAAPSPAKERLYDIGSEFVERAKHSGQMRADASVNDIPTIMCGLCQVAAAERDGRPGMSWERYLGLMLDGLRRR